MASLNPCVSGTSPAFATGFAALAALHSDAPASSRPATTTATKPTPAAAKPAAVEPKPAAAEPKPAASKPAVAAKPPSATGTVEPPRMSAEEVAACSVNQSVSTQQQRLMDLAASIGLSSAKFARVRGDYYEQEMVWRRDVIGAASVMQLCKSMIMENTKVKDKTVEECREAGRVKYVCVVVQYDGPNLNREKLTDVVQAMEGSKAVGKKQYNMRMVDGDVSAALSGFEHNAVTPLGMATPLPVVLSARIAKVPDGQLWLGGGEPDLKLRVDGDEFIKVFNAMDGFSAQFSDVV